MAEMLLSVLETAHFHKEARKLLSEAELNDAIYAIASNPEIGDIMQGTGGVRKFRVAKGSRGKSAGSRIVYYYHDMDTPVFFLTIFAKNERDNLSGSERNDLAASVKGMVAAYNRRRS